MPASSYNPELGVESAPKPADHDHFLIIRVDGDRYALPVPQVREVLRAVWIDLVPHAPAVVVGIIDVRGRYVPVFDLRRRFGRPSPPIALDERFVLAWTGDREIALRADGVDWFADVEVGAQESVGDVLRRDSFVTGLAHAGDGLLLIQDLSAFVTEAESIAVDNALDAFRSLKDSPQAASPPQPTATET